MDKIGTQTNEPNVKKVDNYAQYFRSEIWNRHIVYVKKKRKRTRHIDDNKDASI